MEGLELSVVVPCFNEEKGLFELHRRLTPVCQASVGDSYEIVLINDGSKDNTWRIMCEMSHADKHLISINLSRNYGHQIALSAGLQICRGDRIFVLDADLQDPPELLPQMMALMDHGCDLVFGQRIKRNGETFFKKTSAYLFYRLLNWMSDINIPRDTGDFRLMSRRTVDLLNNMPEHYRFIRGMVSWIGLRQEAFKYERASRFDGETKYSISKMMRFAIDALTGFSVRPLRISSYIGLIFNIVALLLLGYIGIQYISGNNVKGWTFLAVIILALGSAQMLMIGIIGEYLGRLYVESKGRPLFIIQEIVSSTAPLELKNFRKRKDIV